MDRFKELRTRIGNIDQDLERQRQSYLEQEERFAGEKERIFAYREKTARDFADEILRRSGIINCFDGISQSVFNGFARLTDEGTRYTPPEYNVTHYEGYLGHGGRTKLLVESLRNRPGNFINV